MEFGYKKFYSPGSVDALSSCVASLTIASGECQETHCRAWELAAMQKPQETVESFSLTIFFQPVPPSGRKFYPRLRKMET